MRYQRVEFFLDNALKGMGIESRCVEKMQIVIKFELSPIICLVQNKYEQNIPQAMTRSQMFSFFQIVEIVLNHFQRQRLVQ